MKLELHLVLPKEINVHIEQAPALHLSEEDRCDLAALIEKTKRIVRRVRAIDHLTPEQKTNTY